MINRSLGGKAPLFLLIFFLGATAGLYAQDPRVSQYQAIPLLVSPAQTGDFDGKMRITGLYARVDNDLAHNNFFNSSVDWRLGQKGRWGLGLNYFQSGSAKVPMVGKNLGISGAREFFIDKHKFQELRLGFQASYIHGSADENKGPYDRLIDVRTFRLVHREGDNSLYSGTHNYLNYSVGAKYKLTLDRLKIETGFAAYNITNPEYNYINKGSLLKRYRVNALSSIYYQPDPKNAIKFEHYSWKEGIYLRDFKRTRDTTEIHETTYSLTWYRYMKNKSFNIGMYSRSWYAVYSMLGMNFNDKIGVRVSYEVPLLKKYYNVSHFEVSLAVFPFGKKKNDPEQVQKQVEEKNKQLTNQMSAILPFGTIFCLPCFGNLPQQYTTAPDSAKISPIPSAKDSLAVNAGNAITSPAVVLPDTLGNKHQPVAGTNSSPLPGPSFGIKMPALPDPVAVFYKDTIYYDFDKYNIRPDASATLNKVTSLMRNNASLSLDIKSHTDLRGSIPYNKTLSQNRALSAKDYLLKKGIENDRISYSWYGEVLPLNNCEKCNEVLQQKNRRSVLYLKGFERNIGTNFKFGSDSLDKEQLLERIKNFMLLEGSASAAKPSAGASYYTVLTGSVAKNAADNYSYLRGLNVNLFEQTDSRGNRFYFFGVFSTEKEAELKLGHIKSLGFKNARVMKLEQ